MTIVSASSSMKRSRLTVQEICADLGIGRPKAYEMLEARIIPNMRVGRTYIVTRNAYEQWKKTCGAMPAIKMSLAS